MVESIEKTAMKRRKIAIATLCWLICVLATAALLKTYGVAAFMLGILPLIVGGYLLGLQWGLALFAVNVLADLALAAARLSLPPGLLLSHGLFIAIQSGLLLGAGLAGWCGTLAQRLAAESAHRGQLELKVEQLSAIDPLTKLYNRHKLFEQLLYEINQAVRYGHMFSLILVNPDSFHQIDEEYGQMRGDAILVEIARTLKSLVRKTDTVARLSNDEFVVLCSNTKALPNGVTAMRLQQGVSALTFREGFTVTCSFGITQFKEGDSVELMLHRAAAALHAAKEKGGNHIEYCL